MEIFSNLEWWDQKKAETHFNTTFSAKYGFDLAYDELPAEAYENLLKTKTPKWLDTPNNNKIAFLTDGTCGSTCACFMMRGAEEHAGLYL